MYHEFVWKANCMERVIGYMDEPAHVTTEEDKELYWGLSLHPWSLTCPFSPLMLIVWNVVFILSV